ncbi:hypothetical protein [Streptomyces sp. BK340]|uniref:hypothetical protein n=1 Tax=Streptomyces sp. BK340 TaxID=2572903 RepID=UPI0011A749DA|nr:hypothetical protein [Streptomyces sp. BK340]TVZ90369.1 hypothetical protein FB157_11126 [Streptomyces sp. BK340]
MGIIERRTVREHGAVLGRLARLGIRPGDVDYLLCDHLYTRDLSCWLVTTSHQDDLGARPQAAFPNAKAVVQRDELAGPAELHPLQRPWYQMATYRHVPPEAFLPISGSVLLGPGGGG